jgi:hypothetical protein
MARGEPMKRPILYCNDKLEAKDAEVFLLAGWRASFATAAWREVNAPTSDRISFLQCKKRFDEGQTYSSDGARAARADPVHHFRRDGLRSASPGWRVGLDFRG